MARRRFDQNKNRVDYGELLIEDSVFELEQAVGMTYSLDMEALMGIPLCLGMRGEMTSGQRNNPLYVLEACLLYTSPSPRDRTRSRMPSSA